MSAVRGILYTPPMPWKVIETAATPNPNAMKYVLDRPISDKPISFFSPAAGKEHPLAGPLLAIQGVTSILMVNDFVTINRDPSAAWKTITPAVKKVLSTLAV